MLQSFLSEDVIPLSKNSVSDCRLRLFFWSLMCIISEINRLDKNLSLSRTLTFSQSNSCASSILCCAMTEWVFVLGFYSYWERFLSKRLISEMMHFRLHKNSLNLQSDTEFLDSGITSSLKKL